MAYSSLDIINNMWIINLLLSLLGDQTDDVFTAWALRHGKEYALGERAYRKGIFMKNWAYIQAQNLKFKAGLSKF
jgi:hypothetical protein